MRQSAQFNSPSTTPKIPMSLTVEKFPLYRQRTKSEGGRKIVTITRLDSDGSSVSLKHRRGITFEQESVQLTLGREPIDTGNIAYSLGQGNYASGPEQFAQLLALHAKLLAQATSEAGPLPDDLVAALAQSVANTRSTGNGARSERGALHQ